MYTYHLPALRAALDTLLQQHVDPATWCWLNEAAGNTAALNATFGRIPRKTGKALIHVTPAQGAELAAIRRHFSVDGWSIDRLCRVWLFLHLDNSNEDAYVRAIETLFTGAEMHELVALYSALPLLAYPARWRKRCAEGIRSNIGDVLQALMCRNPYPSENLDDAAWNQLVLKAFFTEKPVHQIIGLDERANKELARILSDYAHERWAAHRPVNPQLWRPVGPFIDETLFPDIERIAYSTNSVERDAALLACSRSNYAPAKALLAQQEVPLSHDEQKARWEGIGQAQPALA